ncbi:flagellar hook protein FlgE [Methylorubrum salsuginis]|uniref:Flagellar hook protein FlgE n=1 Tax=Methylorubrum salsuginis TaxID=414703 RepID=A0A1I4DT11_9HYPH|nr:flagellar hook-basal body complex protein [Methylorubrum salsuginis]SFK95071.1 flagellar hook protein FlgE [Methylorubrum salsuginis]
MDVFSALQTAVSGLRAQAFSLDNISGNIANSQTTGYKRIDTTFVDMIAERDTKHQVAGTVAAYSELTNTIQGNLRDTGVSTNMALNGNGFFVVQKRTVDAGGGTAFSSSNLYTRRGDFSPDKDGYLVNGAGSYLTGASLDPATGQTVSNGPIRIANSLLPAKATTTVSYAANLPSTPATTGAKANKGLLPALTGGGADPRVLTGTGTGTVAVSDGQTFIDNSIAGPALTVYDASGAPVSLKTRWAKVANADSTATPATQDTWNLFYADKSTVSDSATSWTNVGQAFQFDKGQLTAPTTTSVTIATPTIDGVPLGPITLDLSGGLTQYASSSGTVAPGTLKQDGYASGSLNAVDVGENGVISGTYSNGRTLELARIAVAQFINPDGLKPDSLGNYQQTTASGEPLAGLRDTTVVGANVEQSNTDVASEFSKMIVTQQAYSANTRVMSTAQSMISDLINVIR